MSDDRNKYIDIAKFVFAVMVVEFHTAQRIFPNGRIAVEGFFMLSGYLMMHSQTHKENLTPSDYLRFMYRKWKGIIIYMIPPAVIGSFMMYGSSFIRSAMRLHNLLYTLVPLQILGFPGDNPLGITWYISSMMVSMAILYPLVRRYGERFTMITAPLISVFIYGYLCHTYHTIGINSWDTTLPVSTGLLRGLAGICGGLFMWSLGQHFLHRPITKAVRIFLHSFEIVSISYIYYLNFFHPRSNYDYYAVFFLFLVLLIGVNRLSFLESLLQSINTKGFGTLSTLLVMTHWSLEKCFSRLFGPDVFSSPKAMYYLPALAVYCFITWLGSRSIKKALDRIPLLL